VVVKSHGSADTVSFSHALDRAASEVEHGLLGLIATEIERLHADGLLTPQTSNGTQTDRGNTRQ
jgi:fatty acid/phospholipid biosynthesis enzyme